MNGIPLAHRRIEILERGQVVAVVHDHESAAAAGRLLYPTHEARSRFAWRVRSPLRGIEAQFPAPPL
jgi:hypothetical protein